MDKVDNDTRMSGFESQFKVQSTEVLSVHNIHSSWEHGKIGVKAYALLTDNPFCVIMVNVLLSNGHWLSIMACFLKPKQL